MSRLRLIAALVGLILLGSSGLVCSVVALATESEAVAAVAEAEAAVAEAFAAALEAETAGAHVAGLLDRLDGAAAYLATAKMGLRMGDFDDAVGNASLCVEAVEGLVEEAGAVRASAVAASEARFWRAMGESVVGVVVVVCGSVLSWRWFKQRYYKRALTMQPEVADE